MRVETGKCNCFTFDATKSSDPDNQKLSYLWNFGDGQTSDQPVVQHCFDKAGDYNVTLSVKDSSGMTCDSNAANVKVSANFPVRLRFEIFSLIPTATMFFVSMMRRIEAAGA